MLSILRLFILFFAVTTSTLCHAEVNLLQVEDINRIMKQIFAQHPKQEQMSPLILKKSLKVYIDQFDPNRVYLLDEEVQPYLNLNDFAVNQMIEEYKRSDFQQFRKLNDLIQKAIFRSRAIRASMESEPLSQFFQKSNALTDGNDEWSDPDLKRAFPKTISELTKRIHSEVVRFASYEGAHYGNDYIRDRQPQVIRLFERQTHLHESPYLFEGENGEKMSQTDQQNAFVMHILKALANALDAHTSVLNQSEAYDMRLRLEKEMQGLGIVLQKTNGGVFVFQLIKSGPAAKSGLVKLGDKIVEIDGNQVGGLPLSQVMGMLRGKKNTKVSLMLQRNDEERGYLVEKTVEVDLTREDIAINDDRVTSNFVTTDSGNVGIIKLDSFYQSDNGITSENDVRDAIKKLDQHGKLKGLILDLRENSGGFLSQAVKVAGLFITNGVIVISKYFNGEEHFYRDMDGKISYEGPLVVLTSKATASAAEIVAQSLQDYGVALIVGDEHTYGKGTIQSQTVTEDQSSQDEASTFFKVTVGKYYTVSGKTPQMQGVIADIVVPSQFSHDSIGEEFLETPLAQDTIASSYEDALTDIAPNLKPWYMRYYAPTLQHKKLFWDEIIPKLKARSSDRMSKNYDFQEFIKHGTTIKGKRPEDMQLTEAVAIVKDMIVLQKAYRGSEADFQGSKAETAGVIMEER